jgi:hypothetical protein
MGLIAFAELGAIGVALALQKQRPPETRVVEKVRYLPMPAVGGAAPVAGTPVPVPAIPTPAPLETALPPAPVPAPVMSLTTPPIADPIVERLVAEAQAARVAEDMGRAIVKLEEAESRAPDEPNMLFQFGEVFEAMGVYDKATDYYQKVFELGVSGGGSLYQLASRKLSQGFVGAEEMQGKMALGRIRQFSDPRVPDGQKVVITVPILAAKGQALVPEDVEVVVSFFDKLDGEVVPAAPRNEPKYKWVTEPVDWKDATGQELLQVTYFIPRGDLQERHLFGQREHFGQLVELSYKSELIDRQAWPRTLAREQNAPERDPLFLPEEFLPDDINMDNPLLPPLPQR